MGTTKHNLKFLSIHWSLEMNFEVEILFTTGLGNNDKLWQAFSGQDPKQSLPELLAQLSPMRLGSASPGLRLWAHPDKSNQSCGTKTKGKWG